MKIWSHLFDILYFKGGIDFEEIDILYVKGGTDFEEISEDVMLEKILTVF